jgi:hypothetical protein
VKPRGQGTLLKAHEYILSKQIQWAMNQGIRLVGSKGDRGRLAYTSEINQNLFEPLKDTVRERFLQGEGNEIVGTPDNAGKMQALHSSSALSVNVFQYWQKINKVLSIAAACGFCREGNNTSQRVVFEDKYPIDARFRFAPNIDVVFHNSDASRIKRFAVECKFSESYGSQGHSGLKPQYMGLKEVWKDIPNTYKLAQSISPNDKQFSYLHPAQLIKHILGLKAGFGKDGFRLLYLWYDVPGDEGTVHRKEIEMFSVVVKVDGLKFHAMTYQELIIGLSNKYRQQHDAYVRYLTERYL